LRDRIVIDKNKKHDIDILVDEIFLSEFTSKESKDNSKERLSEAIEKATHEAEGLVRIELPNESKLMSVKFMCPYDGFAYPEIEPRLFSFNSPYGACEACNGLGTESIFSDDPCKKCFGKRLREEALHVLIEDKNINDVVNLSVEHAREYFRTLKLSDKEKEIVKVVLKEIESRLDFMLDVGIEYLTLNRRAYTLSGGEAQRIRLASQLGSRLVGALYVLDEPTIGLHQRDNDRLISTLTKLRDMGNTIIVVEHDEDTMFASDYIIDIGPRA
jgi:excinuclease ABC subunit A